MKNQVEPSFNNYAHYVVKYGFLMNKDFNKVFCVNMFVLSVNSDLCTNMSSKSILGMLFWLLLGISK